MQCIFIRETWSHMGKSSGFDPLFEAMSKIEGIDAVSYYANQFEKAKPRRWFQRFFKRNTAISIVSRCSPFVDVKHERVARVVIEQMKLMPNAYVFLSVTENQFAPSLSTLSDKELKKLILFVHQPPAWFKLNWSDIDIFSKVKAIVCLSTSQFDFFKEKSKGVPVIQIKHGVDLDFFKPNNDDVNFNGKFLFVGQWFRDFAVLADSFPIIKNTYNNITLHCVIQRKFRNNQSFYKLAQSDAVFFYDDIDSKDLLALYQRSDALFLPLIDSTANNALNEALACGLPIITSNIGGTTDYIYAKGTILAMPGDAQDHARAGIEFIKNATLYSSQKNDIRYHAEQNLNWNEQAKRIVSHLS
jgi:glycosyltransferase involved in cell wall biosynthesis